MRKKYCEQMEAAYEWMNFISFCAWHAFKYKSIILMLINDISIYLSNWNLFEGGWRCCICQTETRPAGSVFFFKAVSI